MTLTYIDEGQTVTISRPNDGWCTATDFAQVVVQLMLAAGYHPQSVQEALQDVDLALTSAKLPS